MEIHFLENDKSLSQKNKKSIQKRKPETAKSRVLKRSTRMDKTIV